jgi:membrane protease YdiL (CAAX protease family)
MMDTIIGQTLRGSWGRIIFALTLAVMTITADFFICQNAYLRFFGYPRPIIALCSILILAFLARWNLASLGVTLQPRQGFLYWIKATLLIGLVVAFFTGIVLVLFRAFGFTVSNPKLASYFLRDATIIGCIKAPLLEECLYRVVLCVPLVALVGSRWTIFISGIIFAALHFVYQLPRPDNFIAGYFLAWAFLKSGSILIPVVIHSLGNACVIVIQLSNWKLLT